MPDVFWVQGSARLNLTQWARVWVERRRLQLARDARETLQMAVEASGYTGGSAARDRAADGSRELLEQSRV